MGPVVDAARLARLVIEADRLCVLAREHERQMVALVEDLQAARDAGRPADVLSRVRAACIAARDQRQHAEALFADLIGGRADDDATLRSSIRVLVVDDSSDARELVAAVLDASGFETITAANGLEAILLAHYARPAMVLMDVNMPVLDGIEATRLLKASAATRDLRVVAHTARPNGLGEMPGALFAAVLAKPASPEALVASVRRFAGSSYDEGGR